MNVTPQHTAFCHSNSTPAREGSASSIQPSPRLAASVGPGQTALRVRHRTFKSSLIDATTLRCPGIIDVHTHETMSPWSTAQEPNVSEKDRRSVCFHSQSRPRRARYILEGCDDHTPYSRTRRFQRPHRPPKLIGWFKLQLMNGEGEGRRISNSVLRNDRSDRWIDRSHGTVVETCSKFLIQRPNLLITPA